MKVIIAGSRTITDYELVKRVITVSNFEIEEVVCGMAKGADLLGAKYARENNIPIKEFPANWNLYGRSAGPKRNKQMAEYADAVIIIWDGFSSGSKNMFEIAKKLGLSIVLYNLALGSVDRYPMEIKSNL